MLTADQIFLKESEELTLVKQECVKPRWNSGMKFNSKKASHWVWKHMKKIIILAWYVKTSDDYFFREVTLFIIFVCLFSY